MPTGAARRRLHASLLGALGVMLWASETALITFTTPVPPLQTVALAFAVAALMSPLVWWVTGGDPMAAFRQPRRVWIVTVASLAGYHACIYYATQKAPPAAAALLQGTTPLMIVLGSALLPGERLRWWHVAGVALGLCGVVALIGTEGGAGETYSDPVFYLSLVGVAAALWGLYSVVSRSFSAVPTSALGVFYAASAILCGASHFAFESWVSPDLVQWGAIAGLGLLPMGLALYLWDYGVKHGDIQALGAFSYVEPFIGAVIVALIGQGRLDWTLFWAGCLVIGGAAMASLGLWRGASAVGDPALAAPSGTPSPPLPEAESPMRQRLVEMAEADLMQAGGELARETGRRVRHAADAPEGGLGAAEVAGFLREFRRLVTLSERLRTLRESVADGEAATPEPERGRAA